MNPYMAASAVMALAVLILTYAWGRQVQATKDAEAGRDYWQRRWRDLRPLGESKGVVAIAFERERQCKEEGYDAQHDARHESGFLAVMGAMLAVHGTVAVVAYVEPEPTGLVLRVAEDAWGLCDKYDRHRRLQLIVAGALIAAEYDRLVELEGATDPAPEPEQAAEEGAPVG